MTRATTGYSNTPLIQQLGIKGAQRLIFLDAPDNYGETLGPLPDLADVATGLDGTLDFVQLFAVSRAELEAEFPRLVDALARDGMLWVSWPKPSSKVDTDLSDNVVREVGLANGLVDVKVCAVDHTWSGLKFVRRLKDRA